MDKQQLLSELKQSVENGSVSKTEVLALFSDNGMPASSDVANRKLNLQHIFYYIGGAIVFLGLGIFVSQNWEVLNFPARLLVTLGASIAAYIVGMTCISAEKSKEVGIAFFLISALTMPVGLGVLFDNYAVSAGNLGPMAAISGITLAVFLVTFFVYRSSFFIVIDIIVGTWFFFAFTSQLVLSDPYIYDWKFIEYRWLIVGLSYMFFGYGFMKTARQNLVGFLNAFGTLALLGAALALGGWSPDQNIFWEILFPGLVFGVIFLSVYLRSRAYLTFGSIFLMVYILKITSEYFSTGFGWPVALIIAGLGLIGVGYFALRIRRKYLV